MNRSKLFFRLGSSLLASFGRSFLFFLAALFGNLDSRKVGGRGLLDRLVFGNRYHRYHLVYIYRKFGTGGEDKVFYFYLVLERYQLGHIYQHMLRQVFWLALYLYFVHHFCQNAPQFFYCRGDTLKLERHRHRNRLALLDSIKIGMDRRARNRVKHHLVDK